jgi:hypothetical protein
MFPDPEQAYMESMEWYESNKQPPQVEEPEGGTE